MKGVKPLNKEKIKQPKNLTGLKKNKPKNKLKKNIPNLETYKKKASNSQYELTFGELNKDLKKGKIKINRRLDLHGYSLTEAYEKFKDEVIKSYNENKRCMLIITGKGNHISKQTKEETKPRLYYGKIKNSIISWVNEDSIKNYILTYQDAGLEHGGDGAIFVYLRKKI